MLTVLYVGQVATVSPAGYGEIWRKNCKRTTADDLEMLHCLQQSEGCTSVLTTGGLWDYCLQKSHCKKGMRMFS